LRRGIEPVQYVLIFDRVFPQRYVFHALEAKSLHRSKLVKHMVVSDTLVESSASPLVVDCRRRVLIIDDDSDQAESIAHGLRYQGFEPYLAFSAEEGLAAIGTFHPDLIIMDICLPDGDGLELSATISDGSETSGIPIIIVSAWEGHDVVRQARAAGCQFFVRKPFDPNALLILVNEALRHEDW
jgi:CheY-like chemotaxis protein